MSRPTWFQRFLLPGFAFKAVVIGGGYATGRELAEFFLPSGPWGGVAGMLLAMAIWSAVCVVTFLFALQVGARDYRSFFRGLLGPAWGAFELAYLLFLIVVLAVFGAAAGAIGEAIFHWPKLAGTLALVAGIAGVTTFGNSSVERLFKWVTFFLYGVYALFVVLELSHFSGAVATAFKQSVPTTGWALGGLTYAGYNVIGAVVILPVVRHLTGRRDAIVAGLIAGPLAMLPALLFFICMCADYPAIRDAALPSDLLLRQLHQPIFHVIFQVMIFSALLESGTGLVNAINERAAATHLARTGRTLAPSARLAVATVVLIGSVFLADRFGLVTLIARGYRLLAYVFLAVYVAPLMTWGLWRLRQGQAQAVSTPA